MFGDLIYTDDIKPTPKPKTSLGKIKDECLSHFNTEHGVWLHFSPEFIDPFSVPKEARLSVLGYYALHPDEALEEFINDTMPSAKRLRRAQLALMWQWEQIETKNKKNFIKHYSKTFGLNSILMGPTGTMLNLAMMLFMLGDDREMDEDQEDEYAAMMMFALLLGMHNEDGPDAYKTLVEARARDCEPFQNAYYVLKGYTDAGMTIDQVRAELEKNLHINSIPKHRFS